jgi:uncharacterized Rossmann fold enzyme
LAKPTLTAVTPFGTFTRKTDHKYAFVIVTDGYKSPERIKANFAKSLAYEQKTLAEYRAVIASGVSPSTYSTIEDYKRYAAGCEAMIAGHPAALEKALAANEAKKGKFSAPSWSTKAHLAEKMAADMRVKSGFTTVHVCAVAP